MAEANSDVYHEHGETNWKRRHENRIKKEEVIKQQKIKGQEHINHVGKLVAARQVGPDCR